MRRYLIDVDDVSLATAPEILPATCELRWDFAEEEGWCSIVEISISLSYETKVINLVGESCNNSLAAPAHKTTNPRTQREQGVVNPLAVNCKIKLYADR